MTTQTLEIKSGMTVNDLKAKLAVLPGTGTIIFSNTVSIDPLPDPKVPSVIQLPVEVK